MFEPDENGMIHISWQGGAVVMPRYEMRCRIEADGGECWWMEEVSPKRVLTEEEWRTVRRARSIMGDAL